MAIQEFSLDQLDQSPKNVRTTRTIAAIEEMAASLKAHGLLQSLVVHPMDGGKFGVAIGRTRLEGLRLLFKRDRLPADFIITADVRGADDPSLQEASLAENIVRTAMHPADQFDAFKKLVDEGRGPEDIAARFGTSPAVVERRLKLARVSPKLIKAYRADEMTLDQLMAFTIVDDHKQQEKVWKELPEWVKERGSDQPIRDQLTEAHISASSKLARFVGIDTYRKAGGGMLRDLFSDDDKSWLTDAALLNRLVGERFEEIVQPIRAEGWKWVDCGIEQDWREEQKTGRILPVYGKPSPKAEEEASSLRAEYDKITEQHGEEPEDESAYNRMIEIQDRIDAIEKGEPAWTDDQKPIAGVVITISHNGEPSIRYGVVKPEDKAAMKKLSGVSNAREPADPKKPKEKAGLSAALITELTSHKNVAAQVVLAEQPKVTLLAVTHALATGVFYHFGDQALQINVKPTTYPMAINDAVKKSAAGKKLAGIMASWKKKIPRKQEQLWGWLVKQNDETIKGLLAVCAAASVDIVQINGAKASPNSTELAKAIKLDMAERWETTAANYFSRVSKPETLKAVTAVAGKAVAAQIAPMKKTELAASAERRVTGKKWLPDVLKP